MKQKIHLKYYDDCKAICACGNTFTTGSTLPEIKVEICANCHPFFTGEMKFVDTMGRVDKFKKKQSKVGDKKYVKKSLRKKILTEKEIKESEKKPKSLKEMIQKEMKKKKKTLK